MKKMQFFIFALSTILFITGCADRSTPNKEGSVSEGTNIDAKETAKKNKGGEQGTNEGTPHQNEATALPMRDFFLEDGSKAHYKGEGNEFAGFTIEVAQPYEDYFVIYENNGGVFLRQIYKVNGDTIETLESTTVNYKDDFPSLEEIEAMKPIRIYLQQPFKEGTTFDDWRITKTDETVETPFRTFENAFIIEQRGTDVINRKYFVQGFGEVKREAIQTTDGKEFTVTSTLESVAK